MDAPKALNGPRRVCLARLTASASFAAFPQPWPPDSRLSQVPGRADGRVARRLVAFLVAAVALILPAAAQAGDLTVNVAESGLGQVRSDTGGINCPGVCDDTFAGDATVTLTASPAPGYVLGIPDPGGEPADLSGWSECAPLPSDPLRCTVQVPAADDIFVDVFFRPAALLLVVANGGGGSNQVTATVPNPQVGEGGEDEGLCFGSEEGGVVCPFPYLPGRRVTLTPSPFDASFPTWSDDDCLAAMACTLVLDAPRQSITATFARQLVLVRVHGNGTVGSGPAGLEECDTTNTTDFPDPDEGAELVCVGEFDTNQAVTLTAGAGATWEAAEPPRAGCDPPPPKPGETVCRVTAERPRWVVVSFGGSPIDQNYPPKVGVRFRVRKSGSGSGSVRGGGIDCGSRCSTDTDFGKRLELVAEASSGSRFARWRRGCGSRARCSLTAGPITRVTAVFDRAATVARVINQPQVTDPPTVTLLQAALDRVKVKRVRRRYRIVLPVHVNLAATVRARVSTRRGRRVARRTWQLPAGERRLTLRVRARRGRYRLSLTIRTTDGQVQVIKRRLRLR